MPEAFASPEALVVEDDPNTLEALAELVRREGFEVSTAEDLSRARTLIRERRPQVVLSDLVLPDGRGTELLGLLDEHPRAEVILVTGNATAESALDALRLGAYDYLTKPVDPGRLKALLASVLRTRYLKKTISTLRSQLRQLGRFGQLVGTSPPMQRVYDLIEKVAPTEATVLLTGESGTGKELASEAIHQLSRRHTAPFVALNCGAVASSLIESQLFGHEKGAFTGAIRQYAGCFEQADGGTLLLDEVTEMPLELQVKLLRVLETKTFQRLGGRETRRANVRLIGSTNRDLDKAVREGHFREDLLYRLKVFPIEMPPLRQRLEDLEVLSLYLLVRMNQDSGERKRLSREALEQMSSYPWPGNVRELKNVLNRAFILADEEIRKEHLLPEVLGVARSQEAQLMLRIGMTVSDAERQLIMATLEHLNGNKRQAAETLGVSLKTLYNRLHAYKAQDEAQASAAQTLGLEAADGEEDEEDREERGSRKERDA